MNFGLSALTDLGLVGSSIKHPRYRTTGGEWDGLAALPARCLRSLTGTRILTPDGMPPDVAAEWVGNGLNREFTPDDLADWLRLVVWPGIAEARGEREAAARRARALAWGARSYYHLRDTQAVLEGYNGLWHKRTVIWH